MGVLKYLLSRLEYSSRCCFNVVFVSCGTKSCIIGRGDVDDAINRLRAVATEVSPASDHVVKDRKGVKWWGVIYICT